MNSGPSESRKIQVIAFDLDDTLIDTSEILVPHAAEAACNEMIKAGLNCKLNECLDMRKKLAVGFSHPEIFRKIHEKFGGGDLAQITQIGIENFYHPKIPSHLPLLPGCRELLEKLKQKAYRLYVVSAGFPHVQKQKLAATGVESFFLDAFMVDNKSGQTKRQAFEEILKTEGIPAHNLLSIGNRLSQEIRMAKQIGAQTCYFAYGEHLGEKPEIQEDHPDYTVTAHNQIIESCKL